jgi:hypothetical protein
MVTGFYIIMHCFHYWISVQTCTEAVFSYQLCQVNRPINRLLWLVAWELCWFSHHQSFRWYISSEFFLFFTPLYHFSLIPSFQVNCLFIFSPLSVNFACLGDYCSVTLHVWTTSAYILCYLYNLPKSLHCNQDCLCDYSSTFWK